MGKRVVARAWVDNLFKAMLMADRAKAMHEMGSRTGPQVSTKLEHDCALVPSPV
jgi:hypothetical protein